MLESNKLQRAVNSIHVWINVEYTVVCCIYEHELNVLRIGEILEYISGVVSLYRRSWVVGTVNALWSFVIRWFIFAWGLIKLFIVGIIKQTFYLSKKNQFFSNESTLNLGKTFWEINLSTDNKFLRNFNEFQVIFFNNI